MANTTPLLDHYAVLNMTRPASPETLFLAFQFEMLSLGALPVEDVAARFDQVSTEHPSLHSDSSKVEVEAGFDWV
jgi:hypothetical protein